MILSNVPIRTACFAKAHLQQRWVSEVMSSLIAAGIPFLVYLRTLPPTVYGLDSAELTTGAFTLGIVHAPGSPLYLIIGHLFTLLPIGDVGYRMNLFSAFAGAVTIFFVYRILLRLTNQRFISLTSSGILAFSFYFWISAVTAKHYALTACLIAAVLWLVLKWRDDGKSWQLLLIAFLFGLGLGNHLSLILLAPGFVWLVMSAPVRLWHQPRLLLGAILFGLLGASVYLYLPLRYLGDAPLNYARDYWQVNLATWNGFWWMVTARMFSSLFFAVPVENLLGELLIYLHRLWSNFLSLGFVLGLIGLMADFRRRTVLHIGLVSMFLGHLIFYIPYRVVDKDTMLIPTYLVWGIWIGLGVDALRKYVQQHAKRRDASLPATLSLVFAVTFLMVNFSYADLSQDWRARKWGEKIFATLEPNAYYFGTWADVPILEYLQLVEGQRPDVTTVNMVFTGSADGTRRAREKLFAGYPVYTSLTWFSNGDIDLLEISSCSCYRAVEIKNVR